MGVIRGSFVGAIVSALALGSTNASDTVDILAMGDWGVTYMGEWSPFDSAHADMHEMAGFINGWGDRTNVYDHDIEPGTREWDKRFYAQMNIANLMGKVADEVQPDAVIGQGDNFYWDGVSVNTSPRFNNAFEQVYTSKTLQNTPFYHVMGNHDVGGAGWLCNSDPTTAYGDDINRIACNGGQNAVDALRRKVNAQTTYKSPSNDRWHMDFPCSKTSFAKDGVTVDVFHVDTNYADTHGYIQICCQCYDQMNVVANPGSINCESVTRGQPGCVADEEFDACASEIESWWDQSLTCLDHGLSESVADWKIVNTHYSPIYHMGQPKQKQWYDIIRGRAQIWIAGHTHSEAHDYVESLSTHFLLNGASGGIERESGTVPNEAAQSEKAESIWTEGMYGFVHLSASKDEMQVRYLTFNDNTWTSYAPGNSGGYYEAHCYNIPLDGSKGYACGEERPTTSPPTQPPTTTVPATTTVSPTTSDARTTSTIDYTTEPTLTEATTTSTAELSTVTTSVQTSTTSHEGTTTAQITTSTSETDPTTEPSSGEISRLSTAVLIALGAALFGLY